MKTLAILGAGGHGKVVGDLAYCRGWQQIIFFDEAWPQLKTVGPWKVVGDEEAFFAQGFAYDEAILAIGDNKKRFAALRRLKQQELPLATLIHPSAIVSAFAKIEPGTVVCAGAVINMDASIGQGCIINTAASVDHDCILEDCVHISPGAHLAGGVQVGARSWIGIAASVRQKTCIGCEVTVGVGAVVVKDVNDGETVIGVPAKSKSLIK